MTSLLTSCHISNMFVDIIKAADLRSRMTCHRQTSTVTWVCGHLGDKPFRRQSSRRQTNSATTNSATRVGQLGDNLFPALYIFRVITYHHIHFGTSVVQRYHKFCDPIHSSHYMVPPHTCLTVRVNPSNTVSVKQSAKAALTKTGKRRQLAPAEVVRVRVRI